jgi:hypothetical protein
MEIDDNAPANTKSIRYESENIKFIVDALERHHMAENNNVYTSEQTQVVDSLNNSKNERLHRNIIDGKLKSTEKSLEII